MSMRNAIKMFLLGMYEWELDLTFHTDSDSYERGRRLARWLMRA